MSGDLYIAVERLATTSPATVQGLNLVYDSLIRPVGLELLGYLNVDENAYDRLDVSGLVDPSGKPLITSVGLVENYFEQEETWTNTIKVSGPRMAFRAHSHGDITAGIPNTTLSLGLMKMPRADELHSIFISAIYAHRGRTKKASAFITTNGRVSFRPVIDNPYTRHKVTRIITDLGQHNIMQLSVVALTCASSVARAIRNID